MSRIHPTLKWFQFGHLRQGLPRSASAECAALADSMVNQLPDCAELSAGLRKLLEAKDCFVRAALESVTE